VRRILGALALVFVSFATAYGQGARSDGVVLAPTGLPVAGASVRVCTQPATGTPCSPLANIYSDVNLTIPALNPLTTDMNGNYFFYVAAGLYTVEFYGMGIVDKQLPDQTISLPLSSNPIFTTVTVSNGIILEGSTSGTTTLLASAIAGNTSATFPAATGNVLLDTASQTISGKSFGQNILPDVAGGRTLGSATLPFSSVYIGGAATNNINVTGTATAARTATLPDNSGTLAELNLAQTWGANQTFPLSSIVPGTLVAGTNGQCVVTSGGASVWGTCTGTPGANTALSNLSAVAINTTLLPASAASVNLGTALLPFGDVFIGGSAGKALHFGVSGLTTTRTATLPDNSGIVAELNLAESWTATQTYINQIVSSVSTGTAPLSIASTTLVPNLNVNLWNGVTLTGTPSAGQAVIATSSSAASWGSPTTVVIGNFSRATRITDVSITPSIPIGIIAVSSTAPSVGCPCRAIASYSLMYTLSNQQLNSSWVTDGTNVFATFDTGINAANLTSMGMANTAPSPVTYANSTTKTFTLTFESSGGSPTVKALHTYGGESTYLDIWWVTSN
jgi:hypothetical protein